MRPTILVIAAALALGGLVILFAAGACGREQDDIDLDQVFGELLGGETTAFSEGRNAFELSARNLTNEERRTFEVGDSFFNQNWVTAPASTEARDGAWPDVQCPVMLLLPQPRRQGEAA